MSDNMMDERKAQLLQVVIEQYIATAEPVGSQFLADEAELGVSGATIRNELRELEEEGYLTHPHTSAGRIPTELGYHYYIAHLMNVHEPKKAELRRLAQAEKAEGIKGLGKTMADLTQVAVIIAMNPDSVYYTGLRNLFTQPEFRDYAHTVQMSVIFDECEERMDELYQLTEKDAFRVVVGGENPLGASCGTVLSRLPGNQLFAIVGPMRMDYARTLGLAHSLQTFM